MPEGVQASSKLLPPDQITSSTISPIISLCSSNNMVNVSKNITNRTPRRMKASQSSRSKISTSNNQDKQLDNIAKNTENSIDSFNIDSLLMYSNFSNSSKGATTSNNNKNTVVEVQQEEGSSSILRGFSNHFWTQSTLNPENPNKGTSSDTNNNNIMKTISEGSNESLGLTMSNLIANSTNEPALKIQMLDSTSEQDCNLFGTISLSGIESHNSSSQGGRSQNSTNIQAKKRKLKDQKITDFF
jgi:hypothetical protein